MAGSDPPSPHALAAIHYLQDQLGYARSYPRTTSDAQRLRYFLIKKSLGWPVVWPFPMLEGRAGGRPLALLVPGVDSLSAQGFAALTGAVILAPGTGIALTEAAQIITIASTITQAGPLGGAAVFRTTDTPNIATGTVTAIAFDNEQFDDSAYHDNAVNASRLTIPATGNYSVVGSAQWDSNNVGTRGLFIQLNGTDTATTRLAGSYMVGTAGFEMQAVSLVMRFTAGDFLELVAFQSSGGNRVIGVAASRPRFAIYRLA